MESFFSVVKKWYTESSAEFNTKTPFHYVLLETSSTAAASGTLLFFDVSGENWIFEDVSSGTEFEVQTGNFIFEDVSSEV